MNGYEVHLAGFEELEPRTAYLVWQLRESVFVVEQGCPYPELDGLDLDPATRHVWIEGDGVPIGYLRILEVAAPSATAPARIGRVVVARPWRGRGVADTLMRTALDHLGEASSVLDAQSYLAQWYRRLGFEQVGPEFLDDGIPHVPMRREGAAAQAR